MTISVIYAKAAEQGFVSESSARRLKVLEETKKQQEIALIQEQIKTPLFTTDQIAFAIYKFRQLDLSTREAKQALIDGFVNAIYLYDDHAKLILNYKNDTKTITLDELQGSDFNSVTAPRATAFEPNGKGIAIHFHKWCCGRCRGKTIQAEKLCEQSQCSRSGRQVCQKLSKRVMRYILIALLPYPPLRG